MQGINRNGVGRLEKGPRWKIYLRCVGSRIHLRTLPIYRPWLLQAMDAMLDHVELTYEVSLTLDGITDKVEGTSHAFHAANLNGNGSWIPAVLFP